MKLSNISAYKAVKIKGRVKLIGLIISLMLMVSCASPVVRTEGPDFGGVTLEDAIREYRHIASIKSVIGIEYEQDGSAVTGDGALSVSPDSLSLRIYYMGFLQGEIYQEGRLIRSNPKLDRYKSAILVNGLKSSIFWWNIGDYSKTETSTHYELNDDSRRILIDKRTLLPTEQNVVLDNGDILNITYYKPQQRLTEDGRPVDPGSPMGWYPSLLKIELGNRVVRISVKSYEIGL
jgi:hypothetical protein